MEHNYQREISVEELADVCKRTAFVMPPYV